MVLCGETGSGKTTQLPKICLQAGRGTRGKIGHTQPRRIAARSLAARIAEELAGELGQQVGYKVRFHDRVQDSSYVKVMTDGILLAEIQSDPELREYDTLIIDEAHERSLNIDFILGYLRLLLPRRPDLKIIITSATIDPDRFSRHFNHAPVIEVSGRTFPVEMRYRPLRGEDEDQKDRDRGKAILDAVDELAAEGPGDVLVFLAGERAIRETSELLRKHHPAHTEILPLYARLSALQQGQVFRNHKRRRIVLATNVAETSLTVPGIHYVVDTGLARISRYSYRTRVQRLPIETVSQASANQRAGRCGRVAAGVCIRLYSEEDYLGSPEFTVPEVQRTNLAAVILQMASLGLGKVEDFPFVDQPDSRVIQDGYRSLHALGAVDDQQQLTPPGKRLARLPLDPGIGRMILAACDFHCLREVMVIAAALSVADPRERPLDHTQAADRKHAEFRHEKSDFMASLNLWKAWLEQKRHLSQNKLRKWCREHFLSYMRMREWQEIHQQLAGIVSDMHLQLNDADADYRSIHSALITGLPGHIAFHLEGREYLGARNLKLMLFPGSGLKKARPKWLVAAELVETGQRYLRTVAAIEPEWVEGLAKHLLKRSYSEPHWEKRQARVAAYERVTLYGLPLVARRKVNYGPIDREVSRSLFVRHALVRGEFHTRHAFALHNHRLLEELDQLETKSRRRDVLVDEEELYGFFDQHIPEDVVDGPCFERWWKKAKINNEKLLYLDRQQIMHHAAEDVTGQQFPDELQIRSLRLAASYHFSPGHQRDGLCVRIPLAALNQLQPEDFEWLVPGLLKEKLILLIKSLPKQLRRNFVPVPRFAEACMQAMASGQGDLLPALSGQLQRISGISIPADSWRPELLPDHLFTSFELVDSTGKQLASGNSLVDLQQQFGAQAKDGFSQVKDSRFEKTDRRDWDFGMLPDFVELNNNGLELRAYPALVKVGDRVDLRLFDRREEAIEAHQQGLVSLFRVRAGRLVREIGRAAPEMQKQQMWYASIGSGAQLLADLEQAVLQSVFVKGADIREPDEFQQRFSEGQKQLLVQAGEMGRWSLESLQAFHELKRVLGKNVPPAFLVAVAEIRQQIEKLVYTGFLSNTPVQWLPHISRYLRAAARRLDKLPENPARDRKQAGTIRTFEERYQQGIKQNPDNRRLLEFRWYIEELRVSLFAQELGTSLKVSPERLERYWSELR